MTYEATQAATFHKGLSTAFGRCASRRSGVLRTEPIYRCFGAPRACRYRKEVCMTVIERVESAMARLLLSATSVDRDVREEADDAVKNLIAAHAYLREQRDMGKIAQLGFRDEWAARRAAEKKGDL